MPSLSAHIKDLTYQKIVGACEHMAEQERQDRGALPRFYHHAQIRYPGFAAAMGIESCETDATRFPGKILGYAYLASVLAVAAENAGDRAIAKALASVTPEEVLSTLEDIFTNHDASWIVKYLMAAKQSYPHFVSGIAAVYSHLVDLNLDQMAMGVSILGVAILKIADSRAWVRLCESQDYSGRYLPDSPR